MDELAGGFPGDTYLSDENFIVGVHDAANADTVAERLKQWGFDSVAVRAQSTARQTSSPKPTDGSNGVPDAHPVGPPGAHLFGAPATDTPAIGAHLSGTPDIEAPANGAPSDQPGSGTFTGRSVRI